MVIDLIVVGVIALTTFLGYRKGLIKVAFKILSFIVAIVLAFTLSTPLANFIIEKTQIDDNIERAIIEKVLPENGSEEQKVKLEDNIVQMLKIDKEATVKTIAEQFAEKTIKVLSLLAIFIAVKLVLLVLMLLTDAIAKIPGIKQIDKLGGTVYGFLKGAFLVLLVFAVIFVLAPMIGPEFIDKISGAPLSGFLYNNNILIKLLFK